LNLATGVATAQSRDWAASISAIKPISQQRQRYKINRISRVKYL
jgi:hypothetical protein